MNKLFTRAFTTREKALLLVLAVLLLFCVYYLAVWQPSMNAIQRAEIQIAQVQDEIAVQEAVAAQRAKIKEEIAEAKAKGLTAKILPNADNTKNIIRELNGILASTNGFTVSFQEPQESRGIVRHAVNVSFTVDSYASAERVMRKLMNCKYSCMVTDMSISKYARFARTYETGTVSASAVVIFFENSLD